jgi:hypothetical protein
MPACVRCGGEGFLVAVLWRPHVRRVRRLQSLWSRIQVRSLRNVLTLNACNERKATAGRNHKGAPRGQRVVAARIGSLRWRVCRVRCLYRVRHTASFAYSVVSIDARTASEPARNIFARLPRGGTSYISATARREARGRVAPLRRGRGPLFGNSRGTGSSAEDIPAGQDLIAEFIFLDSEFDQAVP